MSVATLPAEILDYIGHYVYQDGSFRNYVHYRISFRKTYTLLPEIRNQQDFDILAKSRYRKDSFRVFKNCQKACKLVGNQKFAERVAEYSDLACLEILLLQQNINFLDLFFHCVDLNLHIAADILMKDPRVDPSAQDQKAIKTSCLRDHIEMTSVLLRDARVDPNIAIQYAASENIEKMLKKCPRMLAENKKRKGLGVSKTVKEKEKKSKNRKRPNSRFLLS